MCTLISMVITKEMERSGIVEAWKAYDAAVSSAQEAYDAAVRSARKAYDAAVRPAWEAYDASVASQESARAGRSCTPGM